MDKYLKDYRPIAWELAQKLIEKFGDKAADKAEEMLSLAKSRGREDTIADISLAWKMLKSKIWK